VEKRLLENFRRGRILYRRFCDEVAPACAACDSRELRGVWVRMRRRENGVCLHGTRYCSGECLRQALADLLVQERPAPRRAALAAHRLPLGLILLSRQRLTAEQLRTALRVQVEAGNGRIGEWLQELRFVSQFDVTAALARQWSCPVLRGEAAMSSADCCPAIPLPLLETFQIVPIDLVESTGILLVAFSEGIDYTPLYAIKHMLGYDTESCLVTPGILRSRLQELASKRVSDDVVIDSVQDESECARIIGSYIAKINAREIRLARCGKHVWARLSRERSAINLVLNVPENSKYFTVSSSELALSST
jgi:hypothetical protein